MGILKYGHHWKTTYLNDNSLDELSFSWFKGKADLCKKEVNSEPIDDLNYKRSGLSQWAHFKGSRKAQCILIARDVMVTVPTGSMYGYRFETFEQAEKFFLKLKPNATIHKSATSGHYVGERLMLKRDVSINDIVHPCDREYMAYSVESDGVILAPIDGLDLLKATKKVQELTGCPPWAKFWFGCEIVPYDKIHFLESPKPKLGSSALF